MLVETCIFSLEFGLALIRLLSFNLVHQVCGPTFQALLARGRPAPGNAARLDPRLLQCQSDSISFWPLMWLSVRTSPSLLSDPNFGFQEESEPAQSC